MKLGLKTLLPALLVAALVVPAATAKQGGAEGHGGKPAWAGSGGSTTSGKAHGKPEWAGQGKGHAKKAEKTKAKKAGAAAAGDTTADEGDVEQEAEPKHDNPAWICKFERDMTGADAFADAHGTNDNKANAFGKCVSEEAHARDGVSDDVEESGEATEPAECVVDEETTDEETTDEESAVDEGEAVVEDETADETVVSDEDAESVAEECAPADEGDAEGDETADEAVDEEGSEEPEAPVEENVSTLVRNLF